MVLGSLIRASLARVAQKLCRHETEMVLSRYNMVGKNDFAGAAGKLEACDTRKTAAAEKEEEGQGSNSFLFNCPSGGIGRRARFRV
jgi:hypothetical protein